MSEAPEAFATPRLRLRRPRPADAAAIWEEYAGDREVTRYLSWPTHTGPGDAAKFIAICEASWASGGELAWGITRREADRVIGMVGCRPRGHAVELGYVLGRRYWGQGYMTEGAGVVADWAAGLPGVYRVWAFCHADNVASARVLEKLGMTREGRARRYAVFPNIGAEPYDCLLYARVR